MLEWYQVSMSIKAWVPFFPDKQSEKGPKELPVRVFALYQDIKPRLIL